MNKNRFVSISRLVLLCAVGVGGNFILNTLCFRILKIPLFLDTAFTAAVSFAAGLVPGIATALLTYLAIGVRDGALTPFIVCSIAEVLLICRLNPVKPLGWHSRDTLAAPVAASPIATEPITASPAGVFAKLILLYIAAAFLVSVMGGVIDFLYHNILSIDKPYFSSEDTFKINLLQRGIPLLLVNILARIPINIVDRFIVIFGGYFISRGLKRIKSACIE